MISGVPLSFYGLNKTVGANYGKPMFVYAHGDPDVKPWVNNNLLSPWQAQIGLRYSF